MKRKNILFLICGILVLGVITGCGNNTTENEKSKTMSNESNENQTIGTKKINDWNKNRVGDTLSSSDNDIDNILYRVEKAEDGTYVLYVKNNNDYGVNLFIKMKFYQSSNKDKVLDKSDTISCFDVNGIGAITFKNIPEEYDNYEVSITVNKKAFESASTYVSFEETIKDGNLKINAVNSYKEDIKGLVVTVLYYKNNKVVASETADVGYGRYAIVSDYPKDENDTKIDYDDYEIYLNTAYISQ